MKSNYKTKFVSLAVLVILGGCGGGGEPSAVDSATAKCSPRIITGFVAPISDQTITVEGEEGAGLAEGGTPGIGAGGSLGLFVGVDISAEFANGTTVGPATVDSRTGLVTIVPCSSPLPVRITVSGKRGGKYYEESVDRFVDFEQGSINAVATSIQQNVGITPFTEAIYQRVLALGNDDIDSIRRYGLIAVSAEDAWKDTRRIEIASDELRRELNKYIRAELEVTKFSRLPISVGDGFTPIFDTSANSRYGLLNAGLSYASRVYSNNIDAPSIGLLGQLVTDFRDGQLNGIGLTGRENMAMRGEFLFNYSTFAEDIEYGVSRIAQSNGQQDTVARFLSLFSVRKNSLDVNSDGAADSVYLAWRSDGALFSGPIDPAAVSDRSIKPGPWSTVPGLPPVRYLTSNFGAYLATSSATFAITNEGELFAWGSNRNGELGVGDIQERLVPTRIFGLPAVTSVQSGIATIARTTSGEVYSWGLGSPTEGDGIRRLTPVRVEAIDDAVDVQTSERAFFVLHSTGEVSAWGEGTNGLLGDGVSSDRLQSSPRKILGLTNVLSIAVGDRIATALRSDGRLVRWGRLNPREGSLIRDSVVIAPTVVEQLPDDIFDISAGENQGSTDVLALSESGEIYSLRYQPPLPTPVTEPSITGLFTSPDGPVALTKGGQAWAVLEGESIVCTVERLDDLGINRSGAICPRREERSGVEDGSCGRDDPGCEDGNGAL